MDFVNNKQDNHIGSSVFVCAKASIRVIQKREKNPHRYGFVGSKRHVLVGLYMVSKSDDNHLCIAIHVYPESILNSCSKMFNNDSFIPTII